MDKVYGVIMYYDNGMSYEDYECGDRVIQLCRTKEKALEYIRNMETPSKYEEGFEEGNKYWEEVAEDAVRIFYKRYFSNTVMYEWYMIQEYEVI